MNLTILRHLANFYYPIIFMGTVAFAVLMAPIVFYPLGADDAYWVLLQPAKYNNSLFDSFVRIIESSYNFTGVPRTISLAILIRVWQAMFVMNTSIFFAISPALVWSGIKIFLMVVVIATVWLFLKKYRFRSGSGEVRNLSSNTRRTLIVIMPILMATGFEVPSAGLSNGWIFYPLFTYPPIVISVLVGLALTKSHSLLTRNFAKFVLPVSVFLLFLAWALNLSYELWLISVPFALLILLLDPVSDSKRVLSSFIPKLWVGGVFGGAFSAIFIWTRVQLSTMPCFDTNTCYNGTVIDPRIETIINNFTSAFAGQGLEKMFSPENPGLPRSLVAVGVAASVILLLAIFAFYAKQKSVDKTSIENKQIEFRPLLTLAALMIFLAVTSAILTGVTVRASSSLIEPLNPYRSGPTITISLSLALAILIILLFRFLDGKQLVRNSIKIAGAGLVVVLTTSNFAMNIQETRAEASSPKRMLTQAIHREIALGATDDGAIARRCQLLEDAKNILNENNQVKFIPGAEKAFFLYWGTPFCSTQEQKTVDLNNIDG
jgi:heme/copper-type cytochrome/quinol oxidase subunit 2